MERIGLRELRLHASRWLERVEAGESFELTRRGRVIARLVPIEAGAGGLQALVESGRARRAAGRLEDLGSPLPRRPDEPSLSEILAGLRAHAR